MFVENLEEMRAFAQKIASELEGKRALVLLDGPVGAGKTQFTRFLVEALGSGESCSPSFAIHNSYIGRLSPIEHIDLYRIESEEDLESTGFWELFDSEQRTVVIEWSERLNEFGLYRQLPRTWPRWELKFKDIGGTKREVFVERF